MTALSATTLEPEVEQQLDHAADLAQFHRERAAKIRRFLWQKHMGYRPVPEFFEQALSDPNFKPAIPKEMRDLTAPRLLGQLVQPFVWLLGFGLCLWSASGWLVGPMLLLGGWTFQTSFTNAHHLVHHSYDLPTRFRRPMKEALMTMFGLMFFYASHLFKATHYAHHAPDNRCGSKGDPESVCHLPGLVVFVFGPVFTARVFIFGFKNARSTFDRVLGLIEVAALLTLMLVTLRSATHWWHGEHLGIVQKTLTLYGVEALALLWMFPFNAAWTPHKKCTATSLGQARNSPRFDASDLLHFLSFMLVGGTRWHLLHHAYQGVPSCNLTQVARLRQVEDWMALQPGHDEEQDRHYHL